MRDGVGGMRRGEWIPGARRRWRPVWATCNKSLRGEADTRSSYAPSHVPRLVPSCWTQGSHRRFAVAAGTPPEEWLQALLPPSAAAKRRGRQLVSPIRLPARPPSPPPFPSHTHAGLAAHAILWRVLLGASGGPLAGPGVRRGADGVQGCWHPPAPPEGIENAGRYLDPRRFRTGSSANLLCQLLIGACWHEPPSPDNETSAAGTSCNSTNGSRPRPRRR